MTVPVSCTIKLSDGGKPVPAIAPESCEFARMLAKPVMQGFLSEDEAFSAVVLDAVERFYNCAPEHVARFCRAALREFVRDWQDKRDIALKKVAVAVFPLAQRGVDGFTILTAAEQENFEYGIPLTRDEILAECQRIAAITLRRSGNARGI